MAKKQTAGKKKAEGFTAEERAAMQDRARELKAGARTGSTEGAGDMIITDAAPSLEPKTWYGMPAYAKVGKVA